MKILIAYDGSAHADAAIDDLLRAGVPHRGEAVIVTVAHHGWPAAKHEQLEEGPFGNPWKATMHQAAALSEGGRDRFQSHFPGWSVSCEPLWGDPPTMLLKKIDVWKPDLVVVGSHGRSAAGSLLLGSLSSELVHHAPCTVRVVRNLTRNEGPIRILLATDGSAQADAAVDAVAERTWPRGTEVRVIGVLQALVPELVAPVPALETQTYATEPAYRVIEASEARERIRLLWAGDDAAYRLRRAGLAASSIVVDGDPRHELTVEAARWHADSIFVGARGLGTLDRLLLGSVSGAVVRHSTCAVEIVRI
jgi:nucleotide-binding universal stress UspA family protein